MAVCSAGKEGDCYRKCIGWRLGFMGFMMVIVYQQSKAVLSWMLT